MLNFIQSSTRKRAAQKVTCPQCNEIRLVINENLKRMKSNLCAHCSKGQGRKPKTGFYKSCEQCGTQFWTTPAVNKKFCSKKCTVSISERTCRQCGKQFKPRSDKGIFCSRACHHVYRDFRIEIPCQICGKKILTSPIRPQKFCSRKCLMLRPPQERPNFKHGKFSNKSHPYPYGGKWPSIRKWILERDGHVCQNKGCQSSKSLQVHHKQRFDDAHDKDYQNQPDNLITLCRKHHWAVHRYMRYFSPSLS